MPFDPDTLLKRIRARLPRIDMYEDMDCPMPAPNPPLTWHEWSQAQAALDFDLPELFLRILSEIGNGGFGPAYGLMGLGPGGFTDDMGKTCDRLYADFRKTHPMTPTWQWPKGLLPIATLGCAMYHCLDVPNDRMMIWEPNAWDEKDPLGTCLFVTDLTLYDWFDRWADGDDLFLLIDHPEAEDFALPRLIAPD